MASPSTHGDEAPITIIVRFAATQPDLLLSITSPSTTSVGSIKQLIRSHLPDPLSSSHLRLIAAGKVLPDPKSLSQTLTIPAPPPLPPPSHKGKEPTTTPQARVYIHCSLGDALTPLDLASEVTLAATSNAALAQPSSSTNPAGLSSTTAASPNTPAHSTTPAPRGFDRLLSSGFSASEVASLRAQFLAVHAARHTPDSMPDADSLRAMEERWLDAGPGAGLGGGAAGADGDGAEGDDAGLDDMLWGNVFGFFWPLGAVPWLAREQGVWSRRRRIAVLSGVLINLVFGFFRMSS